MRCVPALAALAVLMVLLGGWLQDETRAAGYHAGIRAAAAYDWPTALARFHAAGSYADAAARAGQAAEMLNQEATLAHAAEYEGLAQNWKELLITLRKLLQIDPHDAGARQAWDTARMRLLDAGLAGTVYLVADGPRSGLYVNLRGGRDIKLPGSDGKSRPRVISAHGDRLIYDRPRTRSGPAASPTARENVLVTFDAANDPAAGAAPARFTTAVLPPSTSGGTDAIFVPGGLLWSTYPRDDGYVDRLLTFYRFADRSILQVSAPGLSTYIGAENEARGLVLLVDPPRWDAYQPTTRLRVEQPGGPRLLDFQEQGRLLTAQFSADGRYLLYALQDGTTSTSLTRSLWLAEVPTTGQRTRPVGGREFLLSITSAGPDSPDLAAEFVPAPDVAAGALLLSIGDSRTESYALQRLDDSSAAPLWSGPAPGRILAHAISDNGAWLARLVAGPDGARLVLQGLQRSTPPITLAGAGLQEGVQLAFAPGSGYLVYSTRGGTSGPRTLVSLALARPGSASAAAPVSLGTIAADTDLPALVLAPGGLVLYLDLQHAPHAVTYDGALDLPLPGPVDGVWSLGAAR